MTVYNMFSILISISSSKRVVRLKRIVNPKFTHHKAIQVVQYMTFFLQPKRK